MSHARTLCPLALGVILAAAGALCSALAADAQVFPGAPAIGNVSRHIESIAPLTGPHGTQVRVRAEGLTPNQNYHVAFGEMQGCGYQICAPVRTNAAGRLAATIQVPDWAHTHHYEVVVVMNEAYEPIAVSDPFHVTDEDGFVQRQGVIGEAWPGCASLEGEGEIAYALVGPRARTLLASQGHEMIVEGRVVEGTCTLQYAIEVESLELVPEGG